VARAALAALWLLVASPAAAEFYRWTDDRGVTHYGEGLGSVPERYRGQAVPLGLRNAPGRSGAPTGSSRPAPGVTIVRYTPGQPIMVDVRINGGASARLLLDTGADRTLISPRALVAAGVPITRPIATGKLSGVTGTDRIDYVVVESLEVGDARATHLPVAVYEMTLTRGDGLLGRDFLDRFNVTIDAARGEVTLAPR
jgi:predicted aspartyl protease